MIERIVERSKIKVDRRVCKWLELCPMKRFYEQGKLKKKWIQNYCKGDYQKYKRFQMEGGGEPHTDCMLPNGEIRESLK